MRVMVGTPCGGGNVTTQYMLSFLNTTTAMMQHRQELTRQIVANSPGFDHANPQHQHGLAVAVQQHAYDISLYTLSGESLIQRGRNHIAQQALAGAYDKLMFIDADAGWTWEQLRKILDNPAPIVAGVCPLKMYPISLNFLPFQEDEQYFDGAIRSVAGMKKLAEGHKSNLVKVPFVGTAFLCIDTKVLRDLSETCDEYIYPNPYTGEPVSTWDFFKVEAISNTFLSEDWGFCHRARQIGYDVLIDTDVVITHVGNHVFRAV